ncbi:DUF262 domain-containing protein [Salmonella enterica]|nr:DUF262 domain-containing protein [Salmonella enterica]EAC1236072.1 DUF262 domain-containing protein [Salmonella enterica subsp. enterica]ECT8305887.1 DUF262 domain-containing protein [Salmonella enterica subsp. enterica serovar Llandoff]EEB7259050.1 DUF262 domain-containing protein [Salmonella enterica subsp. enterica serovar Senftenberg]EEJ6225210.1 DUF262 domain-containing protein [Salmonella enterica subsp. enterica serovar Southbank]EGZ4605570.1 DUF262 domain-containing protein [Salmone
MKIDDRKDKVINLFNDINSGEINTRPDFQRGEVWSSSKKKMLIDTILRKWPIPPIHLVKIDDKTFEVLDGQQRLTAIRDFINNKFSIDGNIQPLDDEIQALNGKKYKQLDDDTKREFNTYRFIIYEMMEYSAGEPGEIFHRLNQSVKLTSSEQRNSLFGELRSQTADFVRLMQDNGVNKDLLGFTNSRLAYNDLIARVGYLLEKNSLRATLNDKVLNYRFRDETGFDSDILEQLSFSILTLANIRKHLDECNYSINLTKASSLNWIYSFAEYKNILSTNSDNLMVAFFNLERAKHSVKNNEQIPEDIIHFFGSNETNIKELLLIYIERSSSRVMTTASIIIRDIIINLSLYKAGITLPDSIDTLQLDTLADVIASHNFDVKECIENLSNEWKVY